MIWILKYLLCNILSWICNRKIRTDNLLYNFDKRHSVINMPSFPWIIEGLSILTQTTSHIHQWMTRIYVVRANHQDQLAVLLLRLVWGLHSFAQSKYSLLRRGEKSCKFAARPINCCNLWILGEYDLYMTGQTDKIQQSFLSTKLSEFIWESWNWILSREMMFGLQ